MLRLQMEKLIRALSTSWEAAYRWKSRLDKIRRKVHRLDDIAWRQISISSFENHYYQVCCSDFNSEPDAFEAVLDARLPGARYAANPKADMLRLGYIGVPPIYTDFYEFLESLGARVVFNEVQRQFSMPFETDDLVEQYAFYTYPYDVFARIEDIRTQIERRAIRGLIHYTQSFCFRQIEDLIIRRKLDIPILTLEGDSPARLDARAKVRIESFIEMLR